MSLEERFTDIKGHSCSPTIEMSNIRNDLLEMPRDEMLMYRDELLQRCIFGKLETSNPGDDPNGWTPFFRGLLWALIDQKTNRFQPEP